ncbi:MAG: 23S rRNA (pseudouridine(1915)-N(3))-methyltransferase RlmH [Rhodospirillales bacterium]|nr:23S rRNA (pseudouridine(1915)-N(3))-methyltransferase RlmH [Alphaproteobacteria bacterium]MCB9980986.1 23S rRNA (pseudouridine(1915)-N(3))-methyltransferase RlmH [Rhodospirillales bacterium]
MNIEILACGRMRKSAHADLFQDYLKRMDWNVHVHEIESRHKDQKKIHDDECAQILERIKPDYFVIAMDERGKTLPSREIAARFEMLQNEGRAQVQCILGGADGLNDEIRARADFLLSFGRQTWPHMLARVMLLEQIYRSQQILKNHPYHRD